MWQSQGAGLAAQCLLDGKTGDECRLSSKLISDFRSANLFWLLMVCIAYMVSNIIRAMRWKDMLRPLGYNIRLFNSLAAIMVAYFANLGVPRLGEILRPTVLARYEDVAIEKVFGTIILERIVDVILFGVMIALGFVFHYDNLWAYITSNATITGTQLSIVLGFLVGIGIAGIFVLQKITSLDESKLSPLAVKIKRLVIGFVEGLSSIKDLPNLPLFIIQSVLIWALYFMMHLFAFWAYDPTALLSAIDAILVFDFGALGIVLPSPGGMGTYHYLIVESLKILDINPVAGFSFAMILFFTVNIGCNVFFGLLSLIGLPIYNKK